MYGFSVQMSCGFDEAVERVTEALKTEGFGVLTSLLFTALHFINHAPLWAAAVFFPSLVFGFFKDRTGKLAAPIILHVFYNSGYFWLFGQ